MTYEELKVNTKIRLKEKPDDEQRMHRMVTYTVVQKYPYMCMIRDENGRRRGAAVGELIMNGVITQPPYFESMRRERDADNRGGFRKCGTKQAAEGAEYAP